MYEAFFGLQKNPFVMTPDPAFLFLTAAHREALAGLTYAILGQKGFVLLTGEAGTGKTTLLHTVLQTIPPSRALFSFVLNPSLSPAEFLEFALMDFGMTEIPSSKAQRLMALKQFLGQLRQQGRIAVLIVDEAHKLGPDLLEEIRLLTNFEAAETKLLQIALAGQAELGEALRREELRQLNQRISVRLAVKPLAEQEVEQYVRHRWVKAGATRELPFCAEAMSLIALSSRGIPRVVNAICDNALLLAYGKDVSSVGVAEVTEVLTDLNLPNGAETTGQTESAAPTATSEKTEMRFLPTYGGLEPGPLEAKPQPPFLMRCAGRLKIGTVRMRT